jgi:hypothetical protein
MAFVVRPVRRRPESRPVEMEEVVRLVRKDVSCDADAVRERQVRHVYDGGVGAGYKVRDE